MHLTKQNLDIWKPKMTDMGVILYTESFSEWFFLLHIVYILCYVHTNYKPETKEKHSLL